MDNLSILIRQLLTSEFQKFKTVTKTNTQDSFFDARIENDIITVNPHKTTKNQNPKTRTFPLKEVLDNYQRVVDYLDNPNIQRSALSEATHNSSYIMTLINEVRVGRVDTTRNHPFWQWYQSTRKLSDSSLKSYQGAFRTIQKTLNLSTQILQITNVSELEKIMEQSEFKVKNNKGKRMYSAPINAYIEYLLYKEDDQSMDDFFKYQVDDINYNSILVHEDTIVPKTPSLRTILEETVEYYNRNVSVSQEAIKKAKFKCEIDGTHETFISANSGENFVEAHHLIPISYQKIFSNSIDVTANIVSLCPNCHRLIHHAKPTEIRSRLLKLYNDRSSRLETTGNQISFDDLISYYSLSDSTNLL